MIINPKCDLYSQPNSIFSVLSVLPNGDLRLCLAYNIYKRDMGKSVTK